MSRVIRTVACAMSGGVDSTVSAYLLKKNGFQVKGVFMTNWDPLDEGLQCTQNQDREDAKMACSRLDIPFYELNFVREYWIYVFQPLIKCYEFGATPNADVLCNRFVKFNFLARKILQSNDSSSDSPIQADAIATGHYCQNSLGNFLQNSTATEPCLLRGTDSVKDQTFWLSTISQYQLRHFMFPVGGLLKPDVKRIAAEIGLPSIAARRESMGMCFIGKRRFSEFIDSYIPPKSGLFRDFETGKVVDEHTGVHHFTLGQRASIARSNGPFYVARMDYQSQDVFVVRDPFHPCLFMRKCWTGPAVWINSTAPELPSPSDRITFQWQNKWRPIRCVIDPHASVAEAALGTHPSVTQLSQPGHDYGAHLMDTVEIAEHDGTGRCLGPCLSIELAEPMRCIAAGQWAALYAGNQCLGGALICGSVSLWDEGQRTRHTSWKYTDYELQYAKANAA